MQIPGLEAVAAILPLPEQPTSTFVGGSLVRGWDHAASDVDIFCIVERLRPETTATAHKRAAGPSTVPLISRDSHGRRWDLEIWSDAQAERAVTAALQPAGELTDDEWDFVVQLFHGRSIGGERWHDRQRQRLIEGRLTERRARAHVNKAGQYLTAADGLLAAGDHEAALLAVHQALLLTADALCAQAGDLAASPKWRMRKLRAAHLEGLDAEEWWQLATFRGDREPADWTLTAGAWIRLQIERFDALTR